MKYINRKIIEEQIGLSRKSKRKRVIYCYSKQEDNIQRMINAVQPDSYIPPHKHLHKTEVFIALCGKFLVVEYDDFGGIKEYCIISGKGENNGAEIQMNTWHNFIALKKDSVLYEFIDGPYINNSEHKIFPEWAPKEEEYEKGMVFITDIKKRLTAKH